MDEVEGQDVAVLRVEPFSARPAIENTLKSGKKDVSQKSFLKDIGVLSAESLSARPAME